MTDTDSQPTKDPVLKVDDLRTHFRTLDGIVRAVDGVNFQISDGQTLGLVGESGCGKTTVARCILRAIRPTSGRVHYRMREGNTVDLASLTGKQLRPLRRDIQMIFQNPYASLNPRMSVRKTLEEPLRFHNPSISQTELQERIADVMESVGVDSGWGERFPHEFSGGQRQRISIA